MDRVGLNGLTGETHGSKGRFAMRFQITGLSPDQFAPDLRMSDAKLAERGVKQVIAKAFPGYPCRDSFEDKQPGDEPL